MVRPVSFKGFQKGFQIFLWELCVCIKYLSLGEHADGRGGMFHVSFDCLSGIR